MGCVIGCVDFVILIVLLFWCTSSESFGITGFINTFDCVDFPFLFVLKSVLHKLSFFYWFYVNFFH